MTSTERVLLSISEQFDAAMRRRRYTLRKASIATGRTFTGSIERVLKAKNTQITTLVDLADGLGCDVEVRLVPRPPQRDVAPE